MPAVPVTCSCLWQTTYGGACLYHIKLSAGLLRRPDTIGWKNPVHVDVQGTPSPEQLRAIGVVNPDAPPTPGWMPATHEALARIKTLPQTG